MLWRELRVVWVEVMVWSGLNCGNEVKLTMWKIELRVGWIIVKV